MASSVMDGVGRAVVGVWRAHTVLDESDEADASPDAPQRFRKLRSSSSLNSLRMSLRKRLPLRSVQTNSLPENAAWEPQKEQNKPNAVQKLTRNARNSISEAYQRFQRNKEVTREDCLVSTPGRHGGNASSSCTPRRTPGRAATPRRTPRSSCRAGRTPGSRVQKTPEAAVGGGEESRGPPAAGPHGGFKESVCLPEHTEPETEIRPRPGVRLQRPPEAQTSLQSLRGSDRPRRQALQLFPRSGVKTKTRFLCRWLRLVSDEAFGPRRSAQSFRPLPPSLQAVPPRRRLGRRRRPQTQLTPGGTPSVHSFISSLHRVAPSLAWQLVSSVSVFLSPPLAAPTGRCRSDDADVTLFLNTNLTDAGKLLPTETYAIMLQPVLCLA